MPIILGLILFGFLNLMIWAIEADRGKTFYFSLAAAGVTVICYLAQGY